MEHSISLEARETAPEIRAAYAACRRVMCRSAKTFYWSSRFLPRERRMAAWAVYAFCRMVDDLVDRPEDTADPRVELESWRRRLIATYAGAPSDPITLAWADLRRRYDVPLQPALDLLDGMRMDLDGVRPATFDDLLLYCYRVAGTVGLLMAPILGCRSPDALPAASELGIAMQLTNILRDVGEDARLGRIYLPREDLERFGYAEDDLMRGVIDEPFIALMRFQVARAEASYARALPGIAFLDPGVRLAIAASAELYRGILAAIVANGYDVFTRRAHVPFSKKLLAMPRLWLGLRSSSRPTGYDAEAPAIRPGDGPAASP